MALTKETSTPYGITANYYRLMSYSENYGRMVAECVYGLYASKEARDAGGSPIQEFRAELPLTDDARPKVYTWLKGNLMEGAVDG